MRRVRIFALPSHVTKERNTGVDFARVVQPMSYLNGYKDKDVEFEVYTYDVFRDEKMNWFNVVHGYDMIFFNYTANAWAFAAMGAFAKKLNKPMVMDMDDNLWSIMPDNPAYSVYHPGSKHLKNLKAICNEVDWITTTNSYLKNVIAHNTYKSHEKIRVFPNYIDLDIYKHRSPFKDTLEIKLLHFGSTTHFIDLQTEEFEKGVDRIFKEYPNVTIKTVGANLARWKHRWGRRYEVGYGDSDIYKWINNHFAGFMDEADILVIPLSENLYTRCKSDIKRLEGSSAVKPIIAQKIRQYQESIDDGVDGLLATTADEWYSKIKLLIEDKVLRKEMSEKGFERIKRDKQMKDHVKEYADFLKEVLDIHS